MGVVKGVLVVVLLLRSCEHRRALHQPAEVERRGVIVEGIVVVLLLLLIVQLPPLPPPTSSNSSPSP